MSWTDAVLMAALVATVWWHLFMASDRLIMDAQRRPGRLRSSTLVRLASAGWLSFLNGLKSSEPK